MSTVRNLFKTYNKDTRTTSLTLFWYLIFNFEHIPPIVLMFLLLNLNFIFTIELDFKAALKNLPVIPTGQALKLRALIDFNDNGTQRIAGDEWQIEGPRTYYPSPECKQVDMVLPMVIEFGKALRLKAKQDLVDRDGIDRVTGIT